MKKTISLLLPIFILITCSMFLFSCSDNNNDTLRCNSCNKKFERYDIWGNLDDDFSSIQLRGMCERCYQNYKWIHG